MKKALIKLIFPLLSRLSKNRIYKDVGSMANLGCGLHCLAGWVNIDGSLTAFLGSRKFSWINRIIYRMAGSSAYYTFPEFDEIIRRRRLYFADLKNGVPFENGSIDVIYCSHFIEHLTREDGARFVKECHRVLRKGGLMRLVLPDLDIAFAMYEKGEYEKVLGLFFHTSPDCGLSAHRYNYNFQTINERLRSAGFSAVDKRSYRQGECPDIEFLDRYPEYSLYVECRK